MGEKSCANCGDEVCLVCQYRQILNHPKDDKGFWVQELGIRIRLAPCMVWKPRPEVEKPQELTDDERAMGVEGSEQFL